MIIQCAWCKQHLGEKAPLKDPAVTHSICEACMRKAVKKNPGKWEPPQPLRLIATSKSTRDQFLLAGDGIVYARTLSGWVNHGTLKEFTDHALRHWKPLKWEENPGESWHAGKMEEAERSEKSVRKPSLKDFFHGKAIAHFESALEERAKKKTRKNPLAVFTVGNPPKKISATIEGIVYNRCLEVRAEKTGSFQKGHWRHPFSKKSQVQILALDNGDLLLHSVTGVRLWKED